MTEITIEIDERKFRNYTDQYIAMAWHVAQHNPVPYGDKQAGQLTERLAREIVRRWLRSVEPEVWKHQGDAHYWKHLTRFAKWNGEDWVAKTPDDGPDVLHFDLYGVRAKCSRPTGKRTVLRREVTCTECAADEPQDGGAR